MTPALHRTTSGYRGAPQEGQRIANLFGYDVATGLSRHTRVLTDCLVAAGYEVVPRVLPPPRRGARLSVLAKKWIPSRPRAALNVFVQEFAPTWLRRAKTNVFVPNQEWFDERELRLLPGIDCVLCTSQHAQEIFSTKRATAVTFGFTGFDRLQPENPASDRTRILHVAGRSPYKGTSVLLRLWRRHPEWPTLTLVHAQGIADPANLPNVEQYIGHLDDAELRRLQNDSWLHLVPTEAEAFGHSLSEGLSVGALVLTTDGPPMNELVQSDHGVLVPFDRKERLHLGYRFFVDEGALESTVERLINSGPGEFTQAMGRARNWFVRNDQRVRQALTHFFRDL